MRDYHAHHNATTKGSCIRAVDLELVASSNLCSWAVSDARLTANQLALSNVIGDWRFDWMPE